MNYEILFHGVEVFILLFGVAAPLIWSALRLRSVLKDFPPHRHVNGRIIYAKDYEPSEIEQLRMPNA